MVYGIAVISLVAAISIALTLQGWKSRIPAFDLLTYIHGVHNFLETGTLLQHGDTGSYGSYKPPGTAWLMLPSALLFPDPRLSEYVGTALLHVLTLSGIYLLARHYFGSSAALLAVVLYGLSEHSLFLAGSLWPNGRPDFYIWIVYFAHQWVTRRDARYLAAALAVWSFGMYVDMAILPLIFILPALWLTYKPPVHFMPLLFVGVVALVVWAPYLRFEAGRGFVDIRSQLLQQHIFPADYRVTWCDPALILRTWEDYPGARSSSVVQSELSSVETVGPVNRLVNSATVAGDKLLYNYRPVAPIPGASVTLLLITLGSLLILSVPGASTEQTKAATPQGLWRYRLQFIAAGLILFGTLISGFVFAARLVGIDGALQGAKFLLLTKIQTMLIVSGVALLAGLWLARAANRVLLRRGVQIQTTKRAEQTRLLVLSLLIPWFILLLFAEPGKPERFMWLWPLQSVFLAAFFTNVLPRFRIPRAAIWTGVLLVILTVTVNPALRWKVESWASSGWAGPDAAEIQVVDAIARQIRAEGKDRATIGYQTFIYPFMAEYNITNPLYKVGSEFDLLFLFRHGIANTNRCAEGVAAEDEYRIVETRPKLPDWSPKEYFLVSMDERFQLVDQFGFYEVYQRDLSPGLD